MIANLLIDFLKKITESDEDYESEGINELQIGPIRDLENKVVRKVLIVQDPSLDALIYAIKNKINFIICRTSLNLDKLMNINEIVSKKLFLITQNHLMVYVLNPSWDNATYGANSYLTRSFGLEIDRPFIINKNGKYVSYGLFCRNSITNRNFNALLFDIKRNLGIEKIPYFMGSENPLEKILISAGNHLDVDILKKAYSNGCNCVITGELTHEELLFLKEYNMSGILLSYYHSMKPGLKQLKRMLSTEFPQIGIDFFDLGEIMNIYDGE